MRLSIAIVSLFLFSTTLQASFMKTGFYSQKKFHQIHIDKDMVALPYDEGIKNKRSTYSHDELDQFKQMGVSIQRRLWVKKPTEIIGYPLEFGEKNDAVAILTHEILVRTDTSSEIDAIKKTTGFASIKETRFKKGLYLVKYNSPLTALKAANLLYIRSQIIYSHPNFLIPKDWRRSKKLPKRKFKKLASKQLIKKSNPAPHLEPLFSHQWHLENTGQTMGVPGADIKAKSAWDITTGDPSIVIAVIDGGFNSDHEDLSDAWFKNPGEIPGDGVDNDNNGLVDDVSGWNFHSNSPDLMDAPFSHHGTAVAGLAGARSNGIGITGVCPKCTVLPITTSFKTEEDAAGIYYAKSMGADIITNSWGYAVGTPATDVVVEALSDAFENGRDGKQTIILFAMNNFDNDDCSADSPDISSLPSVIAVSASTDQDKKSIDAAWGPCMEFISPTWMYQHNNGGIVTTDIMGDEGYNPKRNRSDLPNVNYTKGFSGTSAATPIAAGVFGLVLSVDPRLTRNQALEIVLTNTDKIAPEEAQYDPVTGFSLKYGYGRINAYNSVREAQLRKRRTALIIKGSGI